LARPHKTHEQREAEVMRELLASFPDFAGGYAWSEVPDDPPDFIATTPLGQVGLELVEWLDGAQMGAAQRRESQRDQMRTSIADGWQKEYQPEHLSCVVIYPVWGTRVPLKDTTALRQEFWSCSEMVDRTWATNPDRVRDSLLVDCGSYSVMSKYVQSLQYRSGTQGWKEHGYCWIDIEEDGGSYDPGVVIQTFEQAIENKIAKYADPLRQNLAAKKLKRLELLVHGGFNLYAYNTPRGSLSVEEISRAASAYYLGQPASRKVFDRIWLCNSLNPAGDLNESIGFPREAGRLRWLAELWPNFNVDPRSLG